jgi:hypothetical protein
MVERKKRAMLVKTTENEKKKKAKRKNIHIWCGLRVTLCLECIVSYCCVCIHVIKFYDTIRDVLNYLQRKYSFTPLVSFHKESVI